MKKRVLIVDDDIMTLRILKKYLEEAYDVITENAGYRFVENMGSYNADLILLDIEMPVVNGLQAFEALIANPELNDIPVVLLSGVPDPNLARELTAKGAAGYIVRTIPKSELLKSIEKIFADGIRRRVTKEILILDSDINRLRKMRDELMAVDYKVKVVRSSVEALDHIKNHHPDLFIIGSDISGVSPKELYQSLETVIREEKVTPLVMEESFFSNELIERVNSIIGE